jgi:hypothetical protein
MGKLKPPDAIAAAEPKGETKRSPQATKKAGSVSATDLVSSQIVRRDYLMLERFVANESLAM